MQLPLVLSQVTLSKESMLITWVGLAKSGGGLRSRPEASPSTVGDSALGSSLTDGQTDSPADALPSGGGARSASPPQLLLLVLLLWAKLGRDSWSSYPFRAALPTSERRAMAEEPSE